MSNVIAEFIKKYPDYYVDKKPVIVDKLPDLKKVFMSGYVSNGDYNWYLFLNKVQYFQCSDGKIYKAKLTQEGYEKILEVRGMDPKAKWSIEPEEI